MHKEERTTSVDVQYLNSLMGELLHESDRSVAILLAAELDAQLGVLLGRRLLPPHGKDTDICAPGGALDSFATRIELAHRLGLISDLLRHDLHTIRRIRNAFAHGRKGLTFTAASVRDLIANLEIPNRMYAGCKDRVNAAFGEELRRDGRTRLAYGGTALLVDIHFRIDAATRLPPCPIEWHGRMPA